MTPPANDNRRRLSVTIITKNAAAVLADCLASVAFADELLIVDSGSSDATEAIAARFSARFIKQAWLGYGAQKQCAVDHASNHWVLCLDADERLTPTLADAIKAALADNTDSAAGYSFARCNIFLGKALRHGEGYPDWSLRLFDRRLGHWQLQAVHEKVVLNGIVDRLAGDLLHESAQSLSQYLSKQNNYSDLAATAAYAAGQRCSLFRLCLSPIFRFIKFYLLKAGWRDGWQGFLHIVIGCHNSFYKYAKLIELSHQPPTASSPDNKV